MATLCKRCFILFFPLVLVYLFLSATGDAAGDPLEAASCKDKLVEVLEAVKNRTQELDMKEEKIRIEEERLKSLKVEIENKITELSKQRQDIEKILQAIKTEKQEGMERLAKVYESMPPEEAALRIEKLNKDLAVKLLKTMKEKTAGKILAFVDPAKAAELTQAFGGRLLYVVEPPFQPK